MQFADTQFDSSGEQAQLMQAINQFGQMAMSLPNQKTGFKQKY